MDDDSLSSHDHPDSIQEQDKSIDTRPNVLENVTEPIVNLQPECLEQLKETDPSEISANFDEGRRLSKHPLPNNDKEEDRLQAVHYFLKNLFQANYIAPVQSILKDSNAQVLDICCGSATWITEMATEFPLSSFIGTSLSPVCPRVVPSNCKIYCVNILEGLPFPDNYFDYVHCRCTLAGFNINDWNTKIIPEIVRVSKPDAFYEHCELDIHHVNTGPIMKKITNSEISLGTSLGVENSLFDKLGDFLLSDKNITNINQQQKYCPLGIWGGESGKLNIDIFRNSCLTIRSQMSEFMNITSNEFEDMVNDCIKEAEVFRTYSKIHLIYAQKIVPSISV
ncbi:S-adenosyl-L-methionine-dependent methyltransferase [Gigaspora margarita]|uniref:S-adenosyl-L-methionine-dependent methyltransferase n=1 Tax=Gigaspora margarita TaxID=4874 RepID=A0A8H3WYD4_GIGMA|nr:S-adenosyl-L-methionine-dependent methyltransferase [Gigaspora margarita]